MKRKGITTAMMVVMTAWAPAASAQLMINEVMQSNIYTIMDDLNEMPDSWAEIYNSGETDINLRGYTIGLKDKAKKGYTIDVDQVVKAGGYVLIYCDKVGEGLHTDFRIDSGKGDLYLFDPEGNEVDHISMKKMPAPDVAYGRKSDGASKWGYQLKSTPGAANTSGTSDIILDEVKFSEPGGVWKSVNNKHIYLELPDNAPEGAYILYTTDGSEPSEANSSAKKYDKQVLLKRGGVIRAKAVCEGAISRPSNAQSYIAAGRDIEIPVISIIVNKEYLYDYNIGIFADGPGGYEHENYRYDWRRPINIEYFESGDGAASVINQLSETRVQGGYTRSNALKSMAVYANKRFGVKRFDYEFWAKDKPGVTDNKSFILRNGGNDYNWAYVRDALVQRVIGRNTSIDWQGYSPAVVFINGEYHAMLAVRERSNEDNVSANYDGLEDIDMVENWGEEFKAGDDVAFNELMEFIKSDHSWDEWSEKINLESYTNLMSINYWVYNTDFPHNNIIMWRRTDGVDGRWQWLVKDCDFGLGPWNSEEHVNHDFHQFLYSDNTPGYEIYQRLMNCEEFRQYYIDHLVAYMGDFMNETTFLAYLEEITDENHGEQLISHEKWNQYSWWYPRLDDCLRFMRNWIGKRQRAMSGLMRKSWGLGNAKSIKVNNELTDTELEGLHITYADVALTHNRFDGNDYIGRTLRVKAGDDDNVDGWIVKNAGGEVIEEVEGKSLVMPITTVEPITINARFNNGINTLMAEESDDIHVTGDVVTAKGTIEIYDLSGRLVANGEHSVSLPSEGIYVAKCGTKAKLVK